MPKLFLIVLVSIIVAVTFCAACGSSDAPTSPTINDVDVPVYRWCINYHGNLIECRHRKIVGIGDSYTMRDPVGGVQEIVYWPVKVEFYDYPYWKDYGQSTCPDSQDCEWLETIVVVVYKDLFGIWKALP